MQKAHQRKASAWLVPLMIAKAAVNLCLVILLGLRALSIALETGKILDVQLSSHIANSSYGNSQRITQEQVQESYSCELKGVSEAIVSTTMFLDH